MQCSEVECSAVQCSEVECSAVQCVPVEATAAPLLADTGGSPLLPLQYRGNERGREVV